MNNLNITLSNNQANNKISLIVAQSAFQGLLQSYGQDGVVYKIINYLLLSHKKHKGNVFPAQDTIATYANCSREYVNRILKKLAALGLLRKKRIQYTSCSYWLHPIFQDSQFRWKFKDILPALKWSTQFEKMKRKLALNLHKARSQITLLYNKNYINIKNTFSRSRNESTTMLDSYKTMLRKDTNTPKPAIKESMNSIEFDKHVRSAQNETNYYTRLQMLEDLYGKCHKASLPYVNILIQKVKKKIQETLSTNSSLPF